MRASEAKRATIALFAANKSRTVERGPDARREGVSAEA